MMKINLLLNKLNCCTIIKFLSSLKKNGMRKIEVAVS